MNWFSNEYKVNSDTTVGEVVDLKRQLDEIEGLRVVDERDGKLRLLIGEPKSLSNAPTGSHEFARGFLIFSIMLSVRHVLGNADLWWEECKAVSADGRRLEPTGEKVKITHSGHVMKNQASKEK